MELIEFLKCDTPSMPWAKIYFVVDSYYNVPGRNSKVTIS